MFVESTDFQSNVGKYLDLASRLEIVIMRDGKPIARLVGSEQTISFLTDKLVGILPNDVDEKVVRDMMLSRQ